MDTPQSLPGYDLSPGGLYTPVELRAAEFGPVTTTQNPDPWLIDWVYGARTSRAGVRVSPQGSMALAAYFACIRVIAEDCGKLPLQILERQDRGRRVAREHWLWPILHDEMNDDMSAITAREVMTHHAVGWGNGYGLILRDRSLRGRREGRITGIYPLHPARVIPERDGETGEIRYHIYQSYGWRDRQDIPEIVPADDMIHLKGLGGDGLVGYSIAQIAAESLGLSLAAQAFGASFFGNGAHLGGLLEHPAELSKEAKDYLRASWRDISGPNRAGETAILEEGMKYVQLGIPPDQAQFLETRKFQIREVCRWFRMQPHKIADLEDAHHTNIESQNIEHVTDTMMPWFVRWEQELDRKLLHGTPYYTKHDVRALLRGDQAARAAFYRNQFMIGAMNPNEIRELEDQNPYEGGDEYFLQIQYAPVRKIVDGTAQQARQRRQPMSAGDPGASQNGHVVLTGGLGC